MEVTTNNDTVTETAAAVDSTQVDSGLFTGDPVTLTIAKGEHSQPLKECQRLKTLKKFMHCMHQMRTLYNSTGFGLKYARISASGSPRFVQTYSDPIYEVELPIYRYNLYVDSVIGCDIRFVDATLSSVIDNAIAMSSLYSLRSMAHSRACFGSIDMIMPLRECELLYTSYHNATPVSFIPRDCISAACRTYPGEGNEFLNVRCLASLLNELFPCINMRHTIFIMAFASCFPSIKPIEFSEDDISYISQILRTGEMKKEAEVLASVSGDRLKEQLSTWI